MGSTKENQDSSFILQRADAREDGFLCGVIDGHGADGHLVSEFIRQNLAPSIIRERRAQSAGGTRAAMVRGFVGTAAKLKGVRDVDATESGAAVAVCMKRGKDLYVANVGDTRAVMACLDERGKAHGQALTRDHTAAHPQEAGRVRASGGEVAPILLPGAGYAGPPRVWRRAQVQGGLSVTRAIGDTALNSVGVTPEPEVSKHRVRPCDRMVMLASDGCWDYISNDRAAQIALQHAGDPRKASAAIVREAQESWKKDPKAAGYIDDITCLVAKMQ